MICDIVYIKVFLLLGLEHEHQRPDRDAYISLTSKENRVCPVNSLHLEKFHPDKVTDYGLGYDVCSIMHYGASNFPSCNFTPKHEVSCHIKTPKNTTLHITTLGQMTGLSELDIRGLNKRYPCGGRLCHFT